MATKKPAISRALATVRTDSLKAKERQRERAEDLVALIERRKTDILDAFYDIGVALREITTEKLYVALGHDSLRDLVESRELMAYSTAKELMAIVDGTPRHVALEFGKEKSLELARWVNLTPEVDTPASVYRANEKIDGVPVREATAKHIARARKKLEAALKKKRGETDPEERAAASAARKVQAFLRQHGARKAKAVAKRASWGWVVTAELGVEDADRLGS